MKILTVNWRDIDNPYAGGAEVHLHEIQRRLVTRGHQVTQLATSFEGGAAEAEIDGVRVLRKGNEYTANFVLRGLAQRVLASGDFDVVVEDINKIPFFLPTVSRRPVLAVIPHLFGSTVFRETNPLFALYVWFWEWWIPVIYKGSRFMVISPSTRDDLVSRRIPREDIDVVYCGLDQASYSRKNKPERFTNPTVIHVGRLRKYKSVEIVLEAFDEIRKELPAAKLLIVGDGPDLGRLRKIAKRLRIESSVSFLGHLPHSEKVDLLYRSHVFLNPSPKEGWGLTVIEANACGVPVVASDRPGLKDSVRHGETGFLVPFGDRRAFAERGLEVLRDNELRDNLARKAVEHANSFSWDQAAAETEELLEELSETGERDGQG